MYIHMYIYMYVYTSRRMSSPLIPRRSPRRSTSKTRVAWPGAQPQVYVRASYRLNSLKVCYIGFRGLGMRVQGLGSKLHIGDFIGECYRGY